MNAQLGGPARPMDQWSRVFLRPEKGDADDSKWPFFSDLVDLPQATPKIPGGEWLSSK